MKSSWKRALSLALCLMMVLSMVEIAPMGGRAFASELEDAVATIENIEEPTAPPKPVEEPASPTAAPATPKPTAVEEQPTPVPEITPTPEPAATEETTAVPGATATPEPAEPEEPVESEEPMESPEPTEAPDPLSASLSSDIRSAFANGDAIDVSLRIKGGAPEYRITYQVYLNGAEVANSQPVLTVESASRYSYVARAFGVHTITATVTDATGQTAVASVSVPVAEHDTKSLAEQRKKANQVGLTGDWRKDILAIAVSQLGYRESERDFIIRADGSTQGYTVYGDWYGLPYEEWCAMFVAFCASYANIPKSSFPQESACQRMLDALTASGAYHTRTSGYEPQAGDVVFFNWDKESDPDHVGVVEYVTDGEIHTIEGNCGRAVARANYARGDGRIMGYASMRALMISAGVLDRAVEEARDLIDALPSAEELAAMDIDAQRAAYEQTQAAYDAYMALTEEQQAQLAEELAKLIDLFNFFNGLIMPLDGYSGGEGTAENPYQISTPEDMWFLAGNIGDWNKCFVLTADINLGASEAKPWTPIGNGNSGNKEEVPFSGSFDGRKHTISGLYIQTVDHWQGLFGCVSGTIQNLNVKGQIFASGNVGGIAGELRLGNVKNCSFSGSIQAPIDTTGKTGSDADNGGIVGLNTGYVFECSNSATVESKSQSVGGIVGSNSGGSAVVENCSNTGSITMTEKSSGLGGIAGSNGSSAKITNCSNSGKVDGTVANGQIGGIVGYCNTGTVSQSHNDGAVTGTNYVGGIVGYSSEVTISQCYNTRAVTGDDLTGGVVGYGISKTKLQQCYNIARVSSTGIVGGVVGQTEGKSSITNCYNEGTVSGGTIAGGIVGQNLLNGTSSKSSSYCTVSNCYNSGAVTGQSAGSISGLNSNKYGASTVTNCYYLTGTATAGINGDNAGNQVEAKAADVFKSGEIAWLLYHGTGGQDAWAQELASAPLDDYPLLMNTGVGIGHPKVLKVTFVTTTNDSYQVNYTNSGGTVPLPPTDPATDEKHVFHEWRIGDEKGVKFDGPVTGNADITVVAAQREYFGGEDADTTVVNAVYGEGVEQDLDVWMGYVSGLINTSGKFTYTITENGGLTEAAIDGSKLTVPADTDVNESGYLLTINAHEKQPQISPISIDGYDIKDVTLYVKVIISKVTPELVVSASEINHGQTLEDSVLSGTATHPKTGANVPGTFEWDEPDIVPDVLEAANVGYFVTFTPNDTTNYNPVRVKVTLKVNMGAPEYTPPEANNGTYNGLAQYLITEGSATGGTMKYLVDGDSGEYSSTIPTRVNAGTYKVWYKVFGDDNHGDTEPDYITVTISPVTLTISDQSFVYDGTSELTLTLPGVNEETVTVTLTAYDKDAGAYTYSAEAGESCYTAVIAEPNDTNYAVAEDSGKLTIAQRPVILSWNEPLTFTYSSGATRKVTATVSNKADGDTDSDFTLEYEDNEEIEVGEYTAKVVGLGNENYTLEDGAQNLSQLWHITKEKKTITLDEIDSIVYGDSLTLTARFGPDSSGITEADTVEFYINGKLLSGTVKIDIESGTATITIENAASDLGFSVGANLASVKYSGNNDEDEAESDAITVTVEPKSITAVITGDNITKTYDGDDIATGFELALKSVEACDKDFVSATAKSYTYNSANVDKAETITANGIELSGDQSGNYVLDTTEPVEIPGSILPKPVQLEWKGATGLVYTGNSANVTATAIEPVAGDVLNVTVRGGAETDADTYTATAVELTGADGKPDGNYALPDDGTEEKEYTIAPAPLFIPALTVTYNGTKEFSVEVDGVTPEGGAAEKVAVALTASEPNAGEYIYGSGDKTYAAVTANKNYEIQNGATLTIEKAVPDVTWPRLDRTVYVNDDPLTAAYFTPGSATGVNNADLPGAFTLSGELSWTSSGTKYVSFTFVPDDAVNYVSVTNNYVIVTVVKRQVASVEIQTPITDKVYGTQQDQLGLPATVTITTEDGKKFYNVPVTWSGYDSATLSEQNLTGTLDLTQIAEEVENLAGITASIKVTLQPLEPGSFEYKDKTVVYSGQPVPHEIEGSITGVTRVSYLYEGKEGTLYSASPDGPTDVGTYTVIATFEMEDGYSAIGPVTVTLIILAAEPQVVQAPTPNNRVYDGVSRDLINAGSAIGGTMVYSMTEDGDYSAAIPARANADTYTVWYKVVGGANYSDVGPWPVTVTIRPATVDIAPGHVTYNGGTDFPLTLEGVQLDGDASETVTATLTAFSKNVGEYDYAGEAGSEKYTVVLSSSNYVVGNAEALTIDPLAVVLKWSDQLTFTYNGATHTVTATVSNAIGNDTFELSYRDNTGVDEGEYTAAVTKLGNANYTLVNAVNVTQTWYITKESEIVTLTADERVTYGDDLTLTVTIAPAASGIRLMAAAQDKVEFYANGVLLESVPVSYKNGSRDSGTAALTVKATSANHFSAGNTNAVMAVYGGNGNVTGGESDSITVTVDAKPIPARITGDAAKTYDGTETATGLSIELEDVEDCDAGKVTAAAASYAFEDANAGVNKTIQAKDVTLEGEQRGNYVISNDPVTTTGTIERKVVRLVWSGYTDLVYTGNPANVTATATELVPGDVCGVEVADGDQINVGDYTARAKGLTNPNYALPDDGWTQDYTIAKAEPIVTAPTANDTIYDGTPHELVEAGSAEGGTIWYSLEETGDYSTTIPARTNAGTYTVWYKVVGDENHSDAGPWAITVVILPAKIDIAPDPVFYNGGTTFPVIVNGANGETIVVTLSASSKDAGEYDYAAEAGNGKYTVALSNTNYEVGTAKKLIVKPLPVVLVWGEQLTFTYDGKMHGVTATVSNAIAGDEFSLTYVGNTGINGGEYTAEVIGLGNSNYTLTDAANVTQAWYIVKESENIKLTANDPVVYGEELTLTVEITPAADGARLMALEQNHVAFYANGELLDSVPVTYGDGESDRGTATLTLKATSANHFSAGANAVMAVYGGNDNVAGGNAAITVTVNPKPIAARIIGEGTVKTYDGNNAATGLEIELDGVEDCDKDDVSAAADSYTYNSKNVAEADTITAQNVTLSGLQSGNYVLDTDPVTIAGTIKPKVVRLEWSGYEGLVYTGESANVTATALELIPGDTCTVTVTGGNEIEPGTYTARATGLDNDNYALPAEGTTQEYTIAEPDTDDPDNPGETDDPKNPGDTDDPKKPDNTNDPSGSGDTADTTDSTQGSDTIPQTGDTSRLMMWLLLMALSFGGIVTAFVWNPRTRKKSKR